MFHSIVFLLIITLVISLADPGPPNNSGSSSSSHNYYEYRAPQQTPSPYTGKRNQNSNYSPDQNALAPPYGQAPGRSTANQCKLHINCPSK
jgi:hypothetical protein